MVGSYHGTEKEGVDLDERAKALRIAYMWLEFQMNPLTQMVPGDLDCDACVLARQYLRSLDRFNALVLSRGD